MSALLWALLAFYFSCGALVGLAYVALDQGTRGSGSATELRDVATFLLTAVFWLPYILTVVAKYTLLLLLPVSWTRSW